MELDTKPEDVQDQCPTEAYSPLSRAFAKRTLQLATITTIRLNVSVRHGDRRVYPYLTTVTDRYSNAIMGVVIEAKPPTGDTWVRCLERSMAPKFVVAESVPADIGWNAYGIPRFLEARDQFGAFTQAFIARCRELRIGLVYPDHESEATLARELAWSAMPEFQDAGIDPPEFADLDGIARTLVDDLIHHLRLPERGSPREEWARGGRRLSP